MTRKWIVSIMVLFVLTGIPAGVTAQNREAIAVAAEGPGANAPVSDVGARCAYFLFFNEQGDLSGSMVNPYHGERRGAGPKVVEMLSSRGVHTVIAGKFGRKMKYAMKQKSMVFQVAAGRAGDVVQRITKP
jgi:predicted Fe-Mo cluster-binding NifX family protein